MGSPSEVSSGGDASPRKQLSLGSAGVGHPGLSREASQVFSLSGYDGVTVTHGSQFAGYLLPQDAALIEENERRDVVSTDLAPAGRSRARKRWRKATFMVKMQVAAASHFMEIVMKKRTGAALLDVDYGGSDERKVIEEMYKALKAHRDECERLGRYEEAKKTLQRMHEVRQEQDNKRREEMTKNHLEDNIRVETILVDEIQKLTDSWERRLSVFEDKMAASEQTMADRHATEHQELWGRIFGPLERPKCSTHLLNLRSIQGAVAKQGGYERAHQVQQQADVLQAQEMRFLEIEAAERHEAAAEKMETKHVREREAFEDRAAFGRRKRETQRAQAFQNLEQRFDKLRAELKKTQEREVMQLELAINSSLGLGKNNAGQDTAHGEDDRARPSTAPMRLAQHAYDWNVRFGDKAGNASTLTSALGLSAAEKDSSRVLKPRSRGGRASLSIGSPTFPRPTTGGSMPFYLEPEGATGLQPFRPSSSARIEASSRRRAREFREATSRGFAHDSAIELYSRPVTTGTACRPGSAGRRAATAVSSQVVVQTGSLFGTGSNRMRRASTGGAYALQLPPTPAGSHQRQRQQRNRRQENSLGPHHLPQTPPGDVPATPATASAQLGRKGSGTPASAWGGWAEPLVEAQVEQRTERPQSSMSAGKPYPTALSRPLPVQPPFRPSSSSTTPQPGHPEHSTPLGRPPSVGQRSVPHATSSRNPDYTGPGSRPPGSYPRARTRN